MAEFHHSTFSLVLMEALSNTISTCSTDSHNMKGNQCLNTPEFISCSGNDEYENSFMK